MIVGAVAAMAREARLVRRAAVRAGCAGSIIVSAGGIGPAPARAGARALVAQGATLLLSTGYAGGLDAAVRAGDLLVPETILDDAAAGFAAWAPGRDAILAALTGAGRHHGGALLSGVAVIASIDGKRAAARRSGARGVDLESAAVAAVGRDCAVPFVVLRGVSDDARHALPRAALAASRDDGRVAAGALLAALARRPRELAAVVRLASGVAAADRALAGALVQALPRLAALRPPHAG